MQKGGINEFMYLQMNGYLCFLERFIDEHIE